MKRGYKILCVLADLHIGVKSVSPSEMKRQLKKHFFDVVKKMDPIDALVVAGDTLHTILSLNSEASQLFHWFIDKMYGLAKKKKATLLIVLGTRSHDNAQLDNVKYLQNNDEGVDVRFYDTIEEITLWDHHKVLILPDVRVKDDKEIEKYLDEKNRYDLIIGHGTTDRVQYVVSEVENQPTKTYVYDADKLMAASKGPVLFGHIHSHMSYVDKNTHRAKFYYVGPFTLMERATHGPGWLLVGIDDKDSRNYKVEHIENPDSAEFIEMEVTSSMLSDHPIDDIMEGIDSIADEAKANDLITLRITRSDDQESVDKVLMLETRYRKDPRFSIVKKVKSKKEQEREAQQAERREKYNFLLDNNLPIHEILYQYYESDIKPTLADKTAREANLTLEDFRLALEEQAWGTIGMAATIMVRTTSKAYEMTKGGLRRCIVKSSTKKKRLGILVTIDRR